MILPLEKQVVSLELATKMRSLSAPEGTLYYWYVHEMWGVDEEYKNSICVGPEYNKWNYPLVSWEHYPAYTVAELGEMLPYGLPSCKLKNGDFGSYIPHTHSLHPKFASFIISKDAKTEADARALLWIHLNDNNLLGER